MWLQLQLWNKPHEAWLSFPSPLSLHRPLLWESAEEVFCRHMESFRRNVNCPMVSKKSPWQQNMLASVSRSAGRFAGTHATSRPSAHLSPRTENAICCPAAQQGSSDLEFTGSSLGTSSSSFHVNLYVCVYSLICLYVRESRNQGPTCVSVQNMRL